MKVVVWIFLKCSNKWYRIEVDIGDGNKYWCCMWFYYVFCCFIECYSLGSFLGGIRSDGGFYRGGIETYYFSYYCGVFGVFCRNRGVILG